jgi:hypothetical protein
VISGRLADNLRHQQIKPRITLITLGVDDLERAIRLYRDGLGLPTEGSIRRGADGEADTDNP